jgi:hypothetical protein
VATLEAKRTKAEAKEALARRRAEIAARDAEMLDALNARASAHRHQMAMDALDRIIIVGRAFRLDTLLHILQPQVWVLDEGGRLMGHVLTVDARALDGAADISVLPLVEALDEQWGDVEQRAGWGRAYADALRAIADVVDDHTRAFEAAVALRRTLDNL